MADNGNQFLAKIDPIVSACRAFGWEAVMSLTAQLIAASIPLGLLSLEDQGGQVRLAKGEQQVEIILSEVEKRIIRDPSEVLSHGTKGPDKKDKAQRGGGGAKGRPFGRALPSPALD